MSEGFGPLHLPHERIRRRRERNRPETLEWATHAIVLAMSYNSSPLSLSFPLGAKICVCWILHDTLLKMMREAVCTLWECEHPRPHQLLLALASPGHPLSNCTGPPDLNHPLPSNHLQSKGTNFQHAFWQRQQYLMNLSYQWCTVLL